MGAIGRLGRGGSVPVGYYKDPEKSAKTFIEVDGERYSVPGDNARIEADGKVTLLGRGSNCVNTGGEKVYPEEVEMAIKNHPAVYDSSSSGIPDEKYGQAVAAVVSLREGATLELEELRDLPARPPLRLQAAALADPRRRGAAQRHRQGAVPRRQGDRSRQPRSTRLMRTPLCEEFGIEYPIFAFTPSEHVAAAVSRAGGLGVLGCVRFNDTEELERVLTWLDDNTDGKPYGVDIVMPMKIPTEGTSVDLGAMIPEEHKKFVDETLLKLGVPPLPEGEGREGVLGWLHSVARSHLDVALQHRPVLIANALGSPPVDVIEKCHEHGIKVAALAGAAKHALSHVTNGVDIIVAQGYEAGGHTGEIASMVLTPDIVDAVGPDVPVLGAGGIGSGRQIAASLALGAQGVWTGSIWLGTEEYRNLAANRGWETAFTRATSSDTVRTRVYTGKPARLLKTKWTEAWAEEGAPQPLPMPLQNLLVAEAHNRINAANDPDVISMPVGQIVGRMNEVRPVADVIESAGLGVRGDRQEARHDHGDGHHGDLRRRTPPARRRWSPWRSAVVGLTLSGVTSAEGDPFPAATPPATCGPGARPETGIQGRVPLADYASGRVGQGYRCNTKPLARQGTTGGFKVLRYRDSRGQRVRVLRLDAAVPQGRPLQRRRGPRRRRARHERTPRSRARSPR